MSFGIPCLTMDLCLTPNDIFLGPLELMSMPSMTDYWSARLQESQTPEWAGGGVTGLTSVHITRMRVRINMDMVRVSRVSSRVSTQRL